MRKKEERRFREILRSHHKNSKKIMRMAKEKEKAKKKNTQIKGNLRKLNSQRWQLASGNAAPM